MAHVGTCKAVQSHTCTSPAVWSKLQTYQLCPGGASWVWQIILSSCVKIISRDGALNCLDVTDWLTENTSANRRSAAKDKVYSIQQDLLREWVRESWEGGREREREREGGRERTDCLTPSQPWRLHQTERDKQTDTQTHTETDGLISFHKNLIKW